ncbi:MAG: radical SAM peptide maturase [Marinifilaceae bacterium]
MKSCIQIETNKKLSYLYSTVHNQIFYINPLLSNIINNVDNDSVEITVEETQKQKKKYKYLLDNKLISDVSKKTIKNVDIKAADIDFNLANLRQLTFEITDACNLKCEYCAYGKFYGDYDSRENKYLDIDASKKLIDKLVDLWNSNLNTSQDKITYISFYGGEPLLNMKFIKEIVSYFKSKDFKHNKIQFSMTTNSLLLRKNASYLVENDFHLLLSLDGNKEGTSYRVYANGQNAYDDIISNIDYLKETFPVFFKNNVNFNSVLHDRNSVESLYSYFNKRYSKNPTIGELNNMGIKDSMKSEFEKTYNNFSRSLYSSNKYDLIEDDMFIKIPTIQTFGIFINKYTNNYFKSFLDFYKNKDINYKYPTGTCSPFSKKMFVTVNGKLLACERIGHQFALGSIDKDGVYISSFEISKRYNAYFDKLKKQCESCYVQENCQQCIFNISTIYDKATVCNGFTNKEDFKEYLSSEMSLFERKPEYYSKIIRKVMVE